MGARPYDPTLGRFTAVDPIQGGSLNNYDYAGQDPINGYDLSGLAPGWIGGGAPTFAAGWGDEANLPFVEPQYTARPSIRAARQRAVRQAWAQERNLVARTGQGTRAWTPSEQTQLLQDGKVSGYEGHHINSVAANPKIAGNPDNVMFVTRAEHLDLHGGSWRTPARGPLRPR